MRLSQLIYGHLPWSTPLTFEPPLFEREKEGPLQKFLDTSDVPDTSQFHTFGCPIYNLDPDLQSGNSQKNKWCDRARIGNFVGISREHASSVSLVLNPDTGLVSPQFHIKHDERFETTDYPVMKNIGKWQGETQIHRLKKKKEERTNIRQKTSHPPTLTIVEPETAPVAEQNVTNIPTSGQNDVPASNTGTLSEADKMPIPAMRSPSKDSTRGVPSDPFSKQNPSAEGAEGTARGMPSNPSSKQNPSTEGAEGTATPMTIVAKKAKLQPNTRKADKRKRSSSSRCGPSSKQNPSTEGAEGNPSSKQNPSTEGAEGTAKARTGSATTRHTQSGQEKSSIFVQVCLL